MNLAEVVAELGAMLPTATLDQLRAGAQRVRRAVPGDNGDLVALADGLVALLDIYGDETDREMLVAQLENDLASVRELGGLSAPAPAPPAPAPLAPPAAGPPSGLPPWVDEAMLSEFFDNQQHALDEVEEMLLDAGRAGEAEKLRLARILHSLKGESSTVGFTALEVLYHSLEDRLAAADRLADIVDDAFAVKDWVVRAGPALSSGGGLPSGHAELVARLREHPPAQTAPPITTAPVPTTVLPIDPESRALFEEFYEEASESLIQADELLVASEASGVDAGSIDALFRIFHTLKGLAGFLQLGGIQAMAHAIEALLDDARNDPSTLGGARLDLILRATTVLRKALREIAAAVIDRSGTGEVPGFDVMLAEVIEARRAGRTPIRPTPRTAAPRPEPREAAAPSDDEDEAPRGVAVVRETIKVDLLRVDNLVETIGELVIVEAMVANSGELQLGPRIRHQLAQLSKIVRDLQRQGLALRMVPLRGVFQKMSRLVRDLSRRANKPVNLELAGQDAEMDRSLAERLGDPLVHMMRNAVDHGVEPVEARRAAGKPDTATLRLSAYHEGGNIIIELADDGRGLDREAILRRAVERGLVEPGVELSDREVYELIFTAGFSTAAQVTELSGRGVGMDVVKRTVEDLRGRIQISTERGRGTTFRLVLPLTLAIIDGMLIVAGGRRYVLPTLAVLEQMQPTRDQIHRYAGVGLILDIRGDQLPLVDLGALLGTPGPASTDPTTGFVVVVDGVEGRFGVVVDDLIGQQQVVIKQVDGTLNSSGLFAGAAILSDGNVGLILNPTSLRTDGSPTRRRALEAG